MKAEQMSLLGKKVKVDYEHPLVNEVFEITAERKDSVEITGDFSGGTHSVSQSDWINKNRIKEFLS